MTSVHKYTRGFCTVIDYINNHGGVRRTIGEAAAMIGSPAAQQSIDHTAEKLYHRYPNFRMTCSEVRGYTQEGFLIAAARLDEARGLIDQYAKNWARAWLFRAYRLEHKTGGQTLKSIDAPDPRSGQRLIDTLADSDLTPDRLLTREKELQLKKEVLEAALIQLSPIDQDIIRSYFGLNTEEKEEDQKEIAERYNCTHQAISLRIKNALARLRSLLERSAAGAFAPAAFHPT